MSGPRVLVTVEQLRRRAPGGIGVYARALVGALAARPAGEDEPAVTLFASRSARPPDPLAGLGAPLATSPLPGRLLTRAWDRGIAAGVPPGFAVVHATSLAHPPARRGARAVVTVYDLTWRHVPEAFPRRGRRWHEAAYRRARRAGAHLVAISDEVAAELRADGVPAERVTVAPPGADHLPPADDAAAAATLGRLGVSGPFLLAVGTLEPRKNLTGLFAAYARVRAALPEAWPLVVVGPDGWGRRAEPGAGVLPAGRVEPAALAALYGRARLVAYVPFTEGFGLPPVEAMRAGVPVVASAMPSVGEAARRVDPHDVDDMAAGLLAAATDDALRSRLVADGRRRAAGYTWAACAARHVELWRSAP